MSTQFDYVLHEGIDSRTVAVYPLNERAQDFIRRYTGVRTWEYQHYLMDREFLNTVISNGMRFCGSS